MTEEEIKKEAEQPAEEPKAAEEQPAEPATETEEQAEETPADEKPVEEQSAAEEKPSEEKPAEVDWKLQYARLLADFDNYKKRAARDRDDTYRYVESQVLKDLLPSVDNLAMALDKAENKDEPFVKGVKLVYDGILAMKDGSVLESGTFDELIARKGYFYALYTVAQ